MKTFYLLVVIMCLSSVVVFGANDPNAIDNVKMFSNGDRYILALKNDGSVWGMGENRKGQLRHDVADNIKSWTRIPIFVRISPKKVEWINIASVYAGYMQSMAIDTKGDVWYWGYRYTSKGMERIAPNKVVGLKNIVKISVSTTGYCAIDNVGALWSVDVNAKILKTKFVNVTQIAFTERMTLILADGVLYSWTPINPNPVKRTLKNVTNIQGGVDYCLVTDKDNRVWMVSAENCEELVKIDPINNQPLQPTYQDRKDFNTLEKQIKNLKK